MSGKPEKKKQQKNVKSSRRRTAQPKGSKLRRKPAQENLQKNELLYRTLMENIRLGITLIDTNYRVITTNAGQGKFFKKPHGVFVGKYCFREFEKRSKVCPHCPGTRAMATGRPAEVETEGVQDDGSHVPVRIQAFPVFDTDGAIKGFLEVVENLTERKKAEKILREREEIYRTLVENIGFGINLIDANYRIIMTNATNIRFVKKALSKFLGNYCYKEFEKRDTVCPHCPGKKAMATGRPAEIITEGIGDDGSRLPVHIRTFPVFEDDGTAKGFIEVIEDITERRRAEEKLRESEQRFKTIFENAPDGILLVDVENKKFYMGNKAICRMLGYKQKEIKNLTVSDIHPKEHLSSVLEQFEKQARGEITVAEDIPVKRKDGSVFYADVNAFPIALDGKAYLAGVFRDITANRQAEEALRTSEAQLSNAMNIAKLGYWEYDVADNMFTFNDYFYSIFRTSAKKIGGYKISPARYAKEFVHPDDAPQVAEGIKKTIETKDPNYSRRLEHRIIYADGEVGHIAVRFFAVKDKQGRTVKAIGANQDITESKKAEEELNIYRDKMAQAERLASLGTLSATLAHELTQPLTVIRLSLENSIDDLKAASGSQVVLDMLRDGLKEVSTATSVVDRFRNYARQSSRKTLCETNIGAIADRIIHLLGKAAQRAKMTLHLKGMDKLPLLHSNEKDIEQLFFALTENAIQAADGKKPRQLTIAGVVKDRNIELRFADNCSGIAPENINRIFDPFFTTGSDDGRTGLGLPIAQRIVSEYGGKIRVQSKLRKGTTFYITLPIHSETA
ncbi:MAG: PAS domain S-box protein [Phycisphaerae bacterium]|jgi:PAS domain S-box-containing protein